MDRDRITQLFLRCFRSFSPSQVCFSRTLSHTFIICRRFVSVHSFLACALQPLLCFHEFSLLRWLWPRTPLLVFVVNTITCLLGMQLKMLLLPVMEPSTRILGVTKCTVVKQLRHGTCTASLTFRSHSRRILDIVMVDKEPT